jgi:anti-sigma-K factor RskA
MTDLQRDRLLELLADQAVFGLSTAETAELERLKKQFPDWEKDFSFELAATAINLSAVKETEEMPAALRTKIFANADEFFNQSDKSSEIINSAAPAETAAVEATQKTFEFEPKRPFWQWLGWAFAAAACVALAINLWITRSSPKTEIVQNPPPVQSPTPKLSPAQERAQLLSAANDAVKIPLADPKNAKEVLGEMVWSNTLQKGYARFNNLPANNAAKETYQLWIVDETQNPKNPAISGGVFDISTTGEVIIPIDPQLTVRKPTAIAVTVEKPGGVVVSAQEKVVAFAKI